MPDAIPTLSFDEVIDRLLALQQPYHQNYLTMYSSWYGGIITDPALMMIPVDDHLVHRGDGVFEACKCIDGKVYALDRHLDRMNHSAKGSVLILPERARLVEIILAAVRAANAPDCFIKLFVSRGPGGFSANPYECPESQLYVVVTKLPTISEEKYTDGTSMISSRIPVKRDFFATIKSCNYLPNVLMKKEAVDAGADYAVSIDDQGCLGEGPTENIGIITPEKRFLVPKFNRTLRGITVSRMMELSLSLVASGELTGTGEADITPQQAYEAAEVMVFGTSFDVLPVVNYDGRPIGDGRPGPFSRKFRDLMQKDIRTCAEMATPIGR